MLSSSALAPASSISRGVVDPALVGDAVEAGDDGDVDRLAGARDQIEILVRTDAIVGRLGKIAQRLGEAFGRDSVRWSWRAASASICSSNSEGSTTAAAPASSRRRMLATSVLSGEAEATSGFLRRQPHIARRQVHHVLPRGAARPRHGKRLPSSAASSSYWRYFDATAPAPASSSVGASSGRVAASDE